MKMWIRPVPPDFTFKDLRSSFGTAVLRHTHDVVAAQRLLGHSDPRVTERHYLGHDIDRLKEQLQGIRLSGHKEGTPPAETPKTPEAPPQNKE